MKNKLENHDIFDYRLETSDWRYSASIVGLIKYFDFLYKKGFEEVENLYKYEKDSDFIDFNSSKITEEYYLLFVESYFEKNMHHRIVEAILDNEEYTEEQIKLVNEKLKANTIMKNTLKGITFDGSNKDIINKTIDENRYTLIKETYRRAKYGYGNFNNENLLLSKDNKISRVVNYCADVNKKGKSLSYRWDITSYVFLDDIVFDFIPFAFSTSYDAFFIHNNVSVEELLKVNSMIEFVDNPRENLFANMKNSSEYIDFDVEVITKNRDDSYYKTLFIRKPSIAIFKNISNYKGIQFAYRDNEKNPRYMEKEIVDCILNGVKLDSIIELLMKSSKNNYSYNIKTLIQINNLIYYKGVEKMDNKMKSAYAAAKSVRSAIDENKVNSYKQKLISSITFKDYDRFCEILIQLAAYSKVNLNFAYDLFDNFEENKNIAYTFINALNKENKSEKGEA